MQTEPLLYEAFVATGKVYTVFRDFPLDGHANALPAAKAARCAGAQDPAWFWQMHDWIYANYAAWSGAADADRQFRAQALEFGVDGVRFDACLADPGTGNAIRDDVEQGTAVGVRGTPAFVLSRVDPAGEVLRSTALSGAQPYANFVKTIEALLN